MQCNPGVQIKCSIVHIVHKWNNNYYEILGVYITNGFHQTPNINAIVSKVNYRIHILKKMAKIYKCQDWNDTLQ